MEPGVPRKKLGLILGVDFRVRKSDIRVCGEDVDTDLRGFYRRRNPPRLGAMLDARARPDDDELRW